MVMLMLRVAPSLANLPNLNRMLNLIRRLRSKLRQRLRLRLKLMLILMSNPRLKSKVK